MTRRKEVLSLYKCILRAHAKFLPQPMRQMGDAYVKSEFRLHKNAKAEQVVQFFKEWEKYLQHIEQTGRENQSKNIGLVDSLKHPSTGSSDNANYVLNGQNKIGSFGKNVSRDIIFSEEQETQLGKLHKEAVKVGGGDKL